ncbi:MAG TPA: YciI family protein [Ktedonobacterales bacterium]|jgi:uncharacterized protein YciI
MTDERPALEELQSRLGQTEPIFAVFMETTDKYQGANTPEGREMLRRHYVYLFDLQDRGILLAGGPLDLDKPPAGGIIVIRAPSRAEAEAIAYNETYHVAGWRVNRVRSLVLRFGSLIGPVQKLLETPTT